MLIHVKGVEASAASSIQSVQLGLAEKRGNANVHGPTADLEPRLITQHMHVIQRIVQMLNLT